MIDFTFADDESILDTRGFAMLLIVFELPHALRANLAFVLLLPQRQPQSLAFQRREDVNHYREIFRERLLVRHE